MQSMNADQKSLFYKRINMENVGAFGHSMGGTSSIFTTLRDHRIRAAADLDGSLFGILDNTTFPRPLLALIHDSSPQYEPRLRNEMASLQQRVIEEITQFYKRGMPGYRVTITAARHITFSDATVLPPWTNPGEGLVRMDVMRSYIHAFFDRYLRGRK